MLASCRRAPRGVRLKHCRSLLFLPATSQHLLAKATERGADALVIDLEDSVAPDRKAVARAMARAAVKTLSGQGATVVLRVNGDAALWQQDLDSMPLQQLAAVMLPKVETWGQIDALACALKAMEERVHRASQRSSRVHAVCWRPLIWPRILRSARWVSVLRITPRAWACLQARQRYPGRLTRC